MVFLAILLVKDSVAETGLRFTGAWVCKIGERKSPIYSARQYQLYHRLWLRAIDND